MPDSDSETSRPRVARSVLHATDFSAPSLVAFNHALGLALAGRSRLTMVHVDGRHDAHWLDYPGIRDTLSRWGVLPIDAPRHAIRDLGIKATKVHVEGRDAVKGVLQRAAKVHADMLVLGTQRRHGLSRWLRPSVAETLARKAPCPSLLIPPGCKGFIDRRDGGVSLRRVLVPVAREPSSDVAIRIARDLFRLFDVEDGDLHLLHVGEDDAESLTSVDDVTLESVLRTGNVVDTIIAEAKAYDLVVMTSLGRDSAIDTLWGSTTERVLSGLSSPLLIVPGEPS